jgi:hypothetical protein
VPHREIRPQLAGFDDRVRRIRDSLRGYSSPAEGGSHRYVETGPVDEAAESLAVDDAAALRRWLGRPSVALFLVAAVLTLIAERHLLAGSLGGGRLVPAPDGASDLWRSYFAAFHPFGVGSAATAPPAIALLALLSSILLGHASVAVDLIVLGAVPLAALSAWWGSKAVVTATPLRLWAAASWAALPAVTGSVAGGRIDGCAAAMLIPVTGRVIAAAVRRNRAPGGWTRCFAAGLLLAVATAWAPAVWPLAGVAGAVVVVVLRGGWAVVRRRLAALGTVLVVGFLCCEPWSVALLRHPADIVAGLGIPEPAHTQPLDVARLMFFQPGGPGVPALWVGAALLLAAVVAAARRRPAVTAGLVVLVCGLTGALIVSRLHGIGTSAGRAWPGIELLVAAAGAITVAAAGAEGAQKVLARRSFGVVQPGIGVLAILVAAATGWADVSWVIHGAQGPVRADITATTPLFVGDALDGRDSPRAVVVDGRHPLAVALVRSARGDDLGTAADAAEVASPPSAGAAAATVRAAVADLVAGRSVATRELADSDIGYVVAEGPAAPAVRRGAAAIGGFGVTPSHGLTVLRAPGVTGELILTGGGTTALPASSDGTAVAQVSSAGRSRLLRLAEPASDRWVAELDGRALPRAAAGPLAAWTVPAGEAGTITVRWSSPSRTIWLIVELIVVVAVLLGSIPSPGAADARHRGAT